MNLLNTDNKLNLYDDSWKIYFENIARPAQYIGNNSIVKNSVIMNNTIIEDNVVINKAIIGSNAMIKKNCNIGDVRKIAVIASDEKLDNDTKLEPAEAI